MKRLLLLGVMLASLVNVSFAQVKNLIAALDTVSDEGRPALLNDICWELRNTDPESAANYGKLAIRSARAMNNRKELLDAFNFTGVAFRNRTYYKEALTYYTQGLQLAQELENFEQQGYGFINVANLFIRLKEPREALNQLDKAQPIVEKLNIDNILGYYHLNYGQASLDLGEYESALEHLEQSRAIRQQMNNSNQQSICLKYMGDALSGLTRYGEAIDRYQEAIALMETSNEPLFYATTLNGLASAQMNSGQHEEARRQATESLTLAKEIDSAPAAKEATSILASLAIKQGDFGLANQYQLEVNAYNESILDQSLKNQAEQFDFTLENRQEEYDREKQELAFAAEKKRILILTISVSVALLLIGAGVAVYWVQKRRTSLQKEHLAQVESQKQQLEGLVQERTSKLKAQNEELTRLSDYKQELTHMVAHDLKNSLSGILSMSESRRIDGERIQQTGQTMLTMVSNMLDVQRFEEAGMQLNLQPNSIYSLVERARKQAESQIRSRNINFVNNVRANLGVMADEAVMSRVFSNLLSNAIKFTESGGLITFEATPDTETGFVTIAISDTGVGMDEKTLPHIFEKYYQSESRQYGRARSNGLGLTFCRLATEAHGGEISVSSAPGQGTTFSLKLKAATIEAPVTEKSADDKPAKTPLTDWEKTAIEQISAELDQIPPYEITRIIKVLDQMEQSSPTLESWKKDIKKAAYNWDGSFYGSLTEMVNAHYAV